MTQASVPTMTLPDSGPTPLPMAKLREKSRTWSTAGQPATYLGSVHGWRAVPRLRMR